MSPAHNLLFLPAATVVPLSYCFCFEKHSHMCLSPDNKFIADFQSIICTERTISADKTPQLITAAAECVPTQLRCMKTKQFCHCHLHLIVRNAVLVRPAGCVDTWFVVWLECCVYACLTVPSKTAWLIGWLVDLLKDCEVNWLVAWMVSWLVYWFFMWLTSWPFSWLVDQLV